MKPTKEEMLEVIDEALKETKWVIDNGTEHEWKGANQKYDILYAIRSLIEKYGDLLRKMERAILCPTCNGKGRIPDPTIDGPLSYCGPDGEGWPLVTCRTCNGTGWVEGNP